LCVNIETIEKRDIMNNKIYCKNCNKEIKSSKKTGFNPVFQGKTFKNKKTGKIFSVCYNCLRKIKKG